MILSSDAGQDHIDNPDKIDNKENPLYSSIQRLAALPSLEYERLRKAESKALGVRVAKLDEAVRGTRKASESNSPFTEVNPWPHTVNPPQLLNEIASTVQRFIICSKEVAQATALWIVMTWVIDSVQVAPLAVITAPEKRCGKTLLLALMGRLVARPISASNITPAALFRTIDTWSPTLLIDEADAFMKDNEELRGLLNSGHTRDTAYVIRTVGENFTPTKFNTWGAKAIAGIGHVAGTLMDRAIVLELRRKLPHEKVERIRQAEPALFDELRSKLARFAEDYHEQIRQVQPSLPPSLNDRAQDNWEPLLAIATIAGSEWLQIGIKSALKLSGGESVSQTIGTELLSDIQEIFNERKVERISTANLIQALCIDDERPWLTFNKGIQITPKQLAGKLKNYGIQSKTIRFGYETAKGYEREQFEDAFVRYTSSSENCRHTSHPTTAKHLAVTNTNNHSSRFGCEKAIETDLAIQNAENVTYTYPHVTDAETEKDTCKPLPAKDCDGLPIPPPYTQTEILFA